MRRASQLSARSVGQQIGLRASTSLERATLLSFIFFFFVSCAPVSNSTSHIFSLGDSELLVSARAERGLTSDHLFIVVNGIDVADGPFGSDQAAGTVLRGVLNQTPVEARCGHRWRPGLHIGYRCSVRIGLSDPIELEF